MTTTLRYVAEVAVPNTSNTVASNGLYLQSGQPFIFSLNNIYDPNYTQTLWSLTQYDHQPRGHDQLAAIYNKYCVIGAKVSVKPLFLNHVNNNAQYLSRDLTMYCTIDDDTDTHPEEFSKHEMLEGNSMNHKKIKMIQPFTGQRYANASYRVSSIPQRTTRINWSAKKFFGNPSKLYRPHKPGRGEDLDTTDYEANFGEAPNQQAYLKIWCNNGFDSTTPGYEQVAGVQQFSTIQAQVTIDYIVASHTMKELGKS